MCVVVVVVVLATCSVGQCLTETLCENFYKTPPFMLCRLYFHCFLHMLLAAIYIAFKGLKKKHPSLCVCVYISYTYTQICTFFCILLCTKQS